MRSATKAPEQVEVFQVSPALVEAALTVADESGFTPHSMEDMERFIRQNIKAITDRIGIPN